MITVLVKQDRIHVYGHANTTPKGSDMQSGTTYTLDGSPMNFPPQWSL